MKPVSEFWLGKRYKNGVRNWCKACTLPVTQRQGKIYRQREWQRVMVLKAKSNNRAYTDRPFDLTIEIINELWKAQGGRCYWFGIPMRIDGGARDPRMPSLDKIDPKLGYTKGNVVLACWGANACRGASTPEQFRAFVQELREAWRCDE